MIEEPNLFNKKEEGQETAKDNRSTAKNPKVQNNIKMFLLGLCGLVGAVVIISGGVGIYRVYATASSDPFTVTVAKTLRLPAMKVNGQRVLYSDYINYFQAVKQSADFDAKAGKPALSDEQISDRVLAWLSDSVLVSEAAKTFGVTVEAKDVEDAKKQIMQNFKDTAAADAEISKRYGWNFETYVKNIVSTMILQNKLNQKMSLDQAAKEEVRNRAQKVLEQIKGGAKFDEMAKQYGEDGTATKGGDLGWFAKGEMVPEFEKAAFALKKGELSPELVETEYGYHIILVDDKKTEKVKDSKGKLVDTEKVSARHILFRFPSLDSYMSKISKQASTLLYIKVHNPFTAVPAADTTTQPAVQQ